MNGAHYSGLAVLLVLFYMFWLISQPGEDLDTFWASEYPAMVIVEKSLKQVEHAGYTVH